MGGGDGGRGCGATPAGSLVRTERWRLQPVPGRASGPAPVLVVTDNHLAIQFLLLLLECVLHLFSLQSTIPEKTKANIAAEKATGQFCSLTDAVHGSNPRKIRQETRSKLLFNLTLTTADTRG